MTYIYDFSRRLLRYRRQWNDAKMRKRQAVLDLITPDTLKGDMDFDDWEAWIKEHNIRIELGKLCVPRYLIQAACHASKKNVKR